MSHSLLTATLVGAALIGGGCSSNPSEDSMSARDALGDGAEDSFVTIDPKAAKDTRSTGLYMAELDKAIRAWQEKTWNAATEGDRHKQDQLEIYLENEAMKRKEVLIVELETGADQNRIVAATALGFTRDPAVQSPLLAALEDPNRHVVQNALVGLSLLQDPTTPLDEVAQLMEDDDVSMRANAAYCARCLVEIGADGSILISEARGGLIDEGPLVRSQCALLIALLIDPLPGENVGPFREQLEAVSHLLTDEVPLVRAAAARSLVYIGLHVPELKGDAVRAIFGAIDEEDKQTMNLLLRNLMLVGERNYGTELEEWADWVQRLP